MTQEIINTIDKIRGQLSKVAANMAWMEEWGKELFREDKFEDEPRNYTLMIRAHNGTLVFQRDISKSEVEKEFYLMKAKLKKQRAELEKELEKL